MSTYAVLHKTLGARLCSAKYGTNGRERENLPPHCRFLPFDRVSSQQPNRTVRLVDGPYVHEGIVQVLESGAWRSVCTNSKNWTAADMGVACRQLGFLGGEWHHWHPHLNDTRQILYQDPGREGSDQSVTDYIVVIRL